MREIDRLTTERFKVPSLLLMEAAAGASARAVAESFGGDLSKRTALILCGRGNNGGDGAGLARVLWTMGAKVDLILFGRVDESKGDARTNFEAARSLASFEAGSSDKPSGVTFVECNAIAQWEEITGARRKYDLIVDALFGTGLARPLEALFREVAEHVALMREARTHAHESLPLILSLDVPSGINADEAAPPGEAVRADLTVSFTAPKPANVLPPASRYSGRLIVADIGSPPALLDAAPSKLFLIEAKDARAWLKRTRYAPGSYKNRHGHVLIVAGSRGYTGAPALCGNASMRSGAGLVTVAVPKSAHASASARLLPEVIAAPLHETDEGTFGDASQTQLVDLAERATVVAIGPGLTARSGEVRRFVRQTVERRAKPLIIDADGLNALAPWPSDLRGSRALPLVLTPHEGEMRRLLGDERSNALEDRVSAARCFAVEHELIIVLKGERAIVAAPDGRAFVNPTGNAGLGRGGTGDTLTGIIAGFLAQTFAANDYDADPSTNESPNADASSDKGADVLEKTIEATIAAVYLSGLAADLAARKLGMRALTASDVCEHLSDAFRALDEEGETP